MDKAISASEANQQFSEMLRDVQEGETFVVMSRGRAVARVIPVDRNAEQRSVEGLLTFLDAMPTRHTKWSREELYS